LTRALLADPAVGRVCIYSRGEHAQALARTAIGDDPRLRWFIGDVRSPARLERALHGVDVVINAAALKRIEVGEYEPAEMAATNVTAASTIVDACLAAGVERLVQVSSDKAVAPVSAYGASKLLAERIVLGAPAPLRTAVVRYGNVAGSTGSIIPMWRAAADPVMTDPECTRYWMDVQHAVALVLQGVSAAVVERERRRVLVPTLPAYRLGDLAEAMRIAPRIIGLGPNEKLHETMDGVTDSSQAPRLSVDSLRERLQYLDREA